MPSNGVKKDELKVRVLKLKTQVDQEPSSVLKGERDLAHKYLNKVLIYLMNIDIDYENPWIYMERAFNSDDIGDYFGFVYNITNLSNQRQYVGRKYNRIS